MRRMMSKSAKVSETLHRNVDMRTTSIRGSDMHANVLGARVHLGAR